MTEEDKYLVKILGMFKLQNLPWEKFNNSKWQDIINEIPIMRNNRAPYRATRGKLV